MATVELPPPNPTTCRVAGALLVLLTAWQLLFTVAYAARMAVAGVDPTAAWPGLAGVAGAVVGGSLGLAVAALSGIAAIALLVRPTVGRWPGALAAIAWLPFGCGVVGILLGALLAWPAPAHARQTAGSARQRRERSTSAR